MAEDVTPRDEQEKDETGSSRHEAPKSAPPPEKSRWDKADILFRGVGALVTPIMVGLVGLLVSGYFTQRQVEETNARVYVELMSKREEADTNLRRDMFTKVLEEFLEPKSVDIGPRILKLELLAYNFHDSFDLGPLFQDLRRRIPIETPQGQDQIKRLMKVATEITDKQVQALRQGGAPEVPVLVDFERLEKEPGGFGLIDEILEFPNGSGQRRFIVEVLGRNVLRNELRIRLRVYPPIREQQQTGPPAGEASKPEVDIAFAVGFFDFPGIDNTRLSNAERCAVVVSRMDENSADLRLCYFPAARASIRDKMYIDEIASTALRGRK